MPVSGWELGREKFLCSAFFCSFVVSHAAAIFGEQNIPGVRLLLICERGGEEGGGKYAYRILSFLGIEKKEPFVRGRKGG